MLTRACWPFRRLASCPSTDPRVQGTIRAIERDLIRDGFVMRYDTHQTDDGLPPGEGVFLPCSFWLAGAYALSGRLDEAKTLFERILAITQRSWPALRRIRSRSETSMLGNFPQAFSHVSLLNAAFLLTRLECEPRCTIPIHCEGPCGQAIEQVDLPRRVILAAFRCRMPPHRERAAQDANSAAPGISIRKSWPINCPIKSSGSTIP